MITNEIVKKGTKFVNNQKVIENKENITIRQNALLKGTKRISR